MREHRRTIISPIFFTTVKNLSSTSNTNEIQVYSRSHQYKVHGMSCSLKSLQSVLEGKGRISTFSLTNECRH